MSRKVGIKSFMGWIGLMAYLFACLISSPVALAVSSSFAGSHELSVVDNGTEQTIIFGHHAGNQQHTHAKESPETAINESASVFTDHQKPHADHVIRVPHSHEEVGTQASLNPLHQNHLSDFQMLPENPAPLSFFLQTATLEVLPQPPPPFQPSALDFLQNIRLLI